VSERVNGNESQGSIFLDLSGTYILYPCLHCRPLASEMVCLAFNFFGFATGGGCIQAADIEGFKDSYIAEGSAPQVVMVWEIYY